jgi:hypothetical protein
LPWTTTVYSKTWRSRSGLPDELPALISAGGLRIEHIEPIRFVASIADAALIAARKPDWTNMTHRAGSGRE